MPYIVNGNDKYWDALEILSSLQSVIYKLSISSSILYRHVLLKRLYHISLYPVRLKVLYIARQHDFAALSFMHVFALNYPGVNYEA